VTLRGAIVGLGNVAVNDHVPGWLSRDDVEIVAATDLALARQVTATATLPHARWYDSAEELLARERLDFLDICTPPATHVGLITRALERGLHVLCEKPLVCSPGELSTVSRLAGAASRVLYTVHNWHHAPIVARTTALLNDGVVGRVRRVVWQTLRTQPAAAAAGGTNWRIDPALSGGGILTDHGWHVFYILQTWIGQSPTAVSASLEHRGTTPLRVEDTATVRMTFPDATAEVLLTWAAPERKTWAEVAGTDGTLLIDDDTIVARRGGREDRWPCPPALSAGSTHPDWFHHVASRFLAAVTGATEATSNLDEASLCVTLESLARESSRRGEVTLSLPALPPSGVAWAPA
jgi:predicted dehydrogenase